jgi:hypothetical protein
MNPNNDTIATTLEQYQPHFDRLKLSVYNASSAGDMLLVKWWMRLNETGDIDKLAVPWCRSLHKFMQTYQLPCIFFYGLNSVGEINFACWFTEPSGVSIFAGLWIDPASGKIKTNLARLKMLYSLVFTFYETIVGTTWQPAILNRHIKLGYSVVGNLRKFLGQDIVYLVQMTREQFAESKYFGLIKE